MKICTKCGKAKPLEDFCKNRTKKGGFTCLCKMCRRDEYATGKYVSSKDTSKRKEYYAKNKDKILCKSKEYYAKNKSARILQRKKYRVQNKEIVKGWKFFTKYNLTYEQYAKMLLGQNGVCSICGLPETVKQKGKLRPLSVDHCHRTNTVRGLLCSRCNTAIGLLGDDINIMASAISYLQQDYRRQAV